MGRLGVKNIAYDRYEFSGFHVDICFFYADLKHRLLIVLGIERHSVRKIDNGNDRFVFLYFGSVKVLQVLDISQFEKVYRRLLLKRLGTIVHYHVPG